MKPSSRFALFLITILIQLVGAFCYFVWANDARSVRDLYIGTKAVMIFAPIILFLIGLQLPRLTLRPHFKKSLWLGARSGLLISGLIALIFFLFRTELSSFSGIITTKVETLGIAGFYFPFALFVSLLHSLFEEYYWRWYVVRGLQTVLSATGAILVGNAGFALHHYVLLSQFFPWHLTLLFGTCVGIGGVIWSIMYQKTNSLLAPWLSHAFADIAIFIIGYLLIS